MALGRYEQLKYLEEKQSWDDYFANGNTYRQQLVENAQKVIADVLSSSSLKLKSMFLLWQFHCDQQDAFSQQARVDLMAQLNVYVKEAALEPELIKDIGDKLLAYKEKTDARLAYKLYVDKLISGQLTDIELKKIAAGFYKDGNLDLAENIYDIYIDKIAKSLDVNKLVPELFEIASLFVYKKQGLFDMAYAESIYSKIDGLGVKDAFGQETIYLRAFNLEKFRDYGKAAQFYLQLTQIYPESKYYDEAIFKIAAINAYALSNLAEAKKYFQILSSRTVISPQVIGSFYQLGLFAQWEGNFTAAKDLYSVLLKNAAGNYPSLEALTKDRLSEIEANKELSANLKTFLELSLKNDQVLVETGKLDLEVSNYILEKEQKFTTSSLMEMPQSGCNQVQLQYLWSGDLGGADPKVTESDFQGTYLDAGTKIVNVVIISPAGTIDRSFAMVDVY
jgi:hypothetical protein